MSSAFQGRKGPVTDIAIRYYNSDGTLQSPICVSTPMEVTLNKGISLQELMAATPLGRMGVADVFEKEEKPQIKMTFPVFNPVTVGMREGMRPKAITESLDTWLVWGPRQVTKLIYPAATSSTEEGHGVTASPALAVGEYLGDMGVSKSLTMTGTFNPTTPPTGTATVAVGANMGLGFSEDLLNKYVTLWIPHQVAGIVKLSQADPIERCEINLTGITRTLQLWHLKIFEATLKVDEGDFNLGEDQKVSLGYQIITTGRCRPYEWEWLPQKRSC